MSLTTQVNFNGNCKEALQFYSATFGGGEVFLLTWGASPMAAQAPETNDQSRTGVVAQDFLAPGWYVAPTFEGSRPPGTFLDPSWYAPPMTGASSSAASFNSRSRTSRW